MYNQTDTYKKLLKNPKNNYPSRIFVHHTGGTDKYPLADTSHHTASIVESYHLSRGWDGIGYHYFIGKDGDVWLGRPEHRNGAHVRGYNSKSIGICLAGNFDATMPTKEQEESLTKLLREVSERNNISMITPHRSVANKTCYGNNLSDTWAADLLNKERGTETNDVLLKDATLNQIILRAQEILRSMSIN